MARNFSAALLGALASCLLIPQTTLADEGLNKVNHIIIVMQENHSFDNYFGALAYAPGSPYHAAKGSCSANDHACVDSLTCSFSSGQLVCSNSNLEDNGSKVTAFH